MNSLVVWDCCCYSWKDRSLEWSPFDMRIAMPSRAQTEVYLASRVSGYDLDLDE